MKTKSIMLSVLIALVFMMGTVFSSSGQVSATASTTATIIAPISISKIIDVNFGNIAVSSIAGTVVLSPTSAGTRVSTGGITLPIVTGVVTAAKFTVTGEGTSTYGITLPASVNIAYGGQTMVVNNFTSTPSQTGVLSNETQDIYLGATLNVNGNQLPGTYTNASDLLITVNYN